MSVSEALWRSAFNLCASRLHKRFVAGSSPEDAVVKAEELKKRGIFSVINILGEHVKDKQEAEEFLWRYLKLIHALSYEGFDYNHIAVKPSQLGLEVSEELCRNNLQKILEHSRIYLPHSLVEIDREGHDYAKDVRDISLDLARSFSNLRVACQINLKETPGEIKQFATAGISVRLCKGTAYPGDVKKEKELRKIFLEQALLISQNGNRPTIATHDLYLIDKLNNLVNLEFQVLLGIENNEMEKLAKEGRRVMFYIPCGSNWRPYGERRGKAIPKIWLRNFFYRLKRR